MTCIGGTPAATMSNISSCGAHGRLPSVPRTRRTPAAYIFARLRAWIPCNCLSFGPVGVLLLELGKLGGRQGRLQPAQIHLHAAIRKVRPEHQVWPGLEHGDGFVVDVLVADAVREGVEIGAHQSFRIVHVEDVRGDAQTEFVRLVDDGGILFRCHLLDLALPVVDPDLDDVDLVRRELLHGLAAFRLGVDLERRAPWFEPR